MGSQPKYKNKEKNSGGVEEIGKDYKKSKRKEVKKRKSNIVLRAGRFITT